MQRFFWHTLEKPIIGLAPMDGVTDFPFRHITKKYGNPDVIYTEFTSVEGVCHGATQLLKDFLYDESQRPIIAQVYGTTPTFFRQAAVLLSELGFDGIDINMGCPAKNVAHSGAGAALIKTPKLAQEIIHATKAGIRDWYNGMTARNCENISDEIATEVERRHDALPTPMQQKRPLPVSIKTRIGYENTVIEEWIPTLLEAEPVAIAIHGRTLKQQYGGLANWEQIGRAAELIHKTPTLILGNGDIESLADAQTKIKTYGTDGALLGRITMGNPTIFSKADPNLAPKSPFAIALEHAQLYEQTYQKNLKYSFLPMRKHLGWYIHDIPNASQIRQAIYRSNTSAEFAEILATNNLASS